MNQLTDEEINNIMFKYGLEMDDEHHAAMIREAIEAEHKRLLGVGMEPAAKAIPMGCKLMYIVDYDDPAAVNVYTADQLAAARLQDQQRISDLEAQLAERKPLTDEQIIDKSLSAGFERNSLGWSFTYGRLDYHLLKLARAIEAAHGIGESK